ncbi:lytic transglycosylase domain-containing protein [Acidiphilium sp. C61]|jgi:soluble lytic murein transglycosylase-like protein|uniref:lytic transglycosylase domain-containing protein n=1 Tax=Acidiphilium sp. C61 TaxID=1671485 RepID=UPI001F1E4649|nr:lytic transglycosylase domain-containing protein [Acidiphilium sp. C61]
MQGAAAHPESVAYAIPRSAPANGDEVVLARPLAPSDVALYRRIFADQAAGRMAEAAALIQRLGDKVLMGQVLAQRYLGPHHHSTPPELEAWLRKYGGQPGTGRIRSLLASRLPRGATIPAADVRYLPEPGLAASGAATPPQGGRHLPARLADLVRRLSSAGQTSRAIDLIRNDNHVSPETGAALRAIVARHLFERGANAQALEIAADAAKEGGNHVWAPDFIAGLAAWQLNRLAEARTHFEQAADAVKANPEEHAAGAFWAARAALRLGQPDAYIASLGKAANNQGTFYGMLAARLLGRELGLASLTASLSEADVEAVAAQPEGSLAFALLQVGRTADAALALRSLWPQIKADPNLGRAVLRVAARAGLVDVAVTLVRTLPGNEIAGVTLPLPALHPAGGFRVDPALVYALARTESGFNPRAVSSVGARGLMQLMPATARAMAQRYDIAGNLESPAANLALGQSYLQYLGAQPDVNGDLLRILASYNAGPVAATKWARTIRDGGDPLIFVESIPNATTRRFVRQVLTDSWIYGEQIGNVPASLTALAEGHVPRLQDAMAAIAER